MSFLLKREGYWKLVIGEEPNPFLNSAANAPRNIQEGVSNCPSISRHFLHHNTFHLPNINSPHSDVTSAIVKEENMSLFIHCLCWINARGDCHAASLHEVLNDGVVHLTQQNQN